MTVAADKSGKPLLSEAEFIAGFHAIGEERYHPQASVSSADARGKTHARPVASWALNRYYYQSRIPIKDAAILARQRRSRLPPGVAQRISIMTATEPSQAASKNGCAW